MPCLQHAALKRSASGRSRPGNQRRPLYPDEPPPSSASTRTWPSAGAPGPNRSAFYDQANPLRRRLRANMAVYRSAGLKPKRLLRSGEPPPPSAATRTWPSAGAPGPNRSAFYDQASPLRRRPPREHGRLPSKTTHLSNTEREKLEREIVGLPSKTTQLSNTDGGAICNR